MPLVRDHEARDWRLITWTDVVRPEMSIAEGGSRSGPALVAEVRLPEPREPLFADAYDASFAFPRKQVMARRDTPEGKAEHAAWAAVPPPKETVIVRVGEVTVRASRCPWDPFSDGTIESRGLRLKDKMSIWLQFGEVGDELEAIGARFVEVAGVTHHPDHERCAGSPPWGRRTAHLSRSSLSRAHGYAQVRTVVPEEETCNEGHAEVHQQHHRDRQDVRGIHGRGTSRDEGARPRAEGGRAPRAARGQGGRRKHRAREDRRDAGTGSRHG